MSNFVQLPCGVEVLCESSMRNTDTHNHEPKHRCHKCGAAVQILCSDYDEKDDKHTCHACSQYWELNFEALSFVEDRNSMKSASSSISSPSSSSSSSSTSICAFVPPEKIECDFNSNDDVSEVEFRVETEELEIVEPEVKSAVDPKDKSVSKPETDSKVKRCKACGGTDHQRTSSLKCPFNKKRLKQASTACTPAVDQDPAPTTKESSTINKKTTSTEGGNLNSRKIWNPNCINVATSTEKFQPVVDISSPDFEPINTIFALQGKNHRGRAIPIDPSPSNLMEAYWPLTLIQTMVVNSNTYIAERKKDDPDLAMWQAKPSVCREITVSCMYHFLAIIYYFGIVRLPSKRDYWSSDEYMPQHKVCDALGMNRDRFEFIWRHFKVSKPVTEDHENDDQIDLDNNDDEEDLIELQIERVVRDQEEDAEEKKVSEEEVVDENEKKKVVWFDKIEPLVENVRKVSQKLILSLGTVLSLDEMMIRFQGRSLETHRLRNKPINEGYKFFVLATTNGFVVNFTPDGRTAEKKAQQEYELNKSIGKKESMILFVTSVLDRIRENRLQRLRASQERKTRSQQDDLFFQEDSNPMTTFIIAMDNYFTLPKVIAKLREKGVGVVGTSRFQKTWPPAALKAIALKDAKFNDFFYCVDEHGTLCARWMDNGLVFCVSTIHKVGGKVERMRKRPRVTMNNSAHVKHVWGDEGKMNINIPKLIDDYNHWMGGVDLVDQRIAYYHCNLRCQRNWIPMFLQIMSIIRANSFIVHLQIKKENALSHKQFTCAIIKDLMGKAKKHYLPPRPSPASSPATSSGKRQRKKPPPIKRAVKRTRTKKHSSVATLLESHPERKVPPVEKHIRIKSENKTSAACLWCSQVFVMRKATGERIDWNKAVKRTAHYCKHCFHLNGKTKIFLCEKHHKEFHSIE